MPDYLKSHLSPRIELHSFSDEQSLANAVAERWLREVQTALGPQYFVALSGGRIARRFFSSLVSLCDGTSSALERVHFFWGDERCVPPNHAESNFAIAHERLLAPLAVKSDRIHRIRGEINETLAAAEAETEMLRLVPLNGDRQPILDLVFLGMGEDGHVASLFPNAPVAAPVNGGVYRAVVATKPPPVRITLDYETIAAAREVWVLASGAGKAMALKESLSLEGKTPFARVIRMRQRTVVFSDIPLPE